MSRLFTLTRAARLIGVSRGALQSKIRSGELAAFEGMVSGADLLRAFPEAKLDEGTGLERFERIKDAAFAHRMRERVLPSPEVLMARLAAVSRELVQERARAEGYRAALDGARAGLAALPARASGDAGAALLEQIERSLADPAREAEPSALLVQENFMRIMTAHVTVRPSGREFFVEGGDSLLEAALRAGLSLDYGCSSGTCGKCKARVLSGQVERTGHSDYALSAAEKASGVMLMCCHTAVTDLALEAREAQGAVDMPLQSIEAKVKSLRPIDGELRLLHLQTPRSSRLRFLAGQWVSLSLPGFPAAAFPVASCPCDERNLEFHVRRLPQRRRAEDAFAASVFDGLKPGDAVRVEGPRGEFVLDEDSTRPLALIAWETGFAPVKSLIEHALALEAAETIHLYRLAADGEPYFDNLCRAWSDALDNFRYRPLSLAGRRPDEAAMAAMLDQVVRDHPALGDCDVYVAGSRALVHAAQRLLPEHGVPPERLFAATNPEERAKLRGF